MLKKIIILTVLFFSFYGFVFSNCDLQGNVKNSMKHCLSGTNLYDNPGDLKVEKGFKETIGTWTKNISFYLGILAVFAIIYASANMVFSLGDDEKINKSKTILKWAILGFIGVMLAAAIITLIVNTLYEL